MGKLTLSMVIYLGLILSSKHQTPNNNNKKILLHRETARSLYRLEAKIIPADNLLGPTIQDLVVMYAFKKSFGDSILQMEKQGEGDLLSQGHTLNE